ncbi:MAG TPA: type II toxin-antitoxin system PemK/MazF family toxin [Candidatus Limnocylindrales bacterium]|nr:type II toxin-antitoxin system PemK/MazF family toxin [Candidatus Limnocylindrales bacterium]
MKGKIVLVPFPFTDLTAVKLRPALVLYEGDKDIISVFISSKIPSEPSEIDVLITKNHSGFKKAGFKLDSVIKLDKIATILKDLIVGEIGEINEEIRKEVNQKVIKILEV